MKAFHNDSSKFKVFNLLDKIQTKIEKGFISLGLILATLLIFINIIYTLIFKSSIMWATEVSQYIVVWVVFIGASTLIRATSHVNVDFLIRYLSKKATLCLDTFIYLVLSVFLFYLAYIGWNMTLEVYKTGQYMLELDLSMAWVYLGYPIGLFLMAISSLKIVIIKLSEAIKLRGGK